MKAQDITPQMVGDFNDNGFIRIPQIISKQEAAHYLGVAERLIVKLREEKPPHEIGFTDIDIFVQIVNAWQRDEQMRKLTLRPQPKQDDELRHDHTPARRRLGQTLRDGGAAAHESVPLGEGT